MTPSLFAHADRQRVLQQLRAWLEQGWLRRLDVAFAEFITGQAEDADAQVTLAAALLAHLEGLGHVCLVLDDGLAQVMAQLGVQPALADELLRLARELAPPRGEPAAAWIDALRACDAVWCIDTAAADRGQPLVLERRKLYLRRLREHERRLAEQWLERAARPLTPPAPQVAAWMDRLFEPAQAEATAATEATEAAPTEVAPTEVAPTESASTDWQRVACALALRSRVGVITGGPGTGKTFTAARLLMLLLATAPHPEQLRVALAAPTGKAAARLSESIELALAQLATRLGADEPLLRLAARIEPARTLHALLGARSDTRRLHHHAGRPLDVDVLLLDEASMVHLEMMSGLLDALPPNARLVLLGDADQLASVEPGAVLGELCAHARQGRYLESTVRDVQALCGQRIDAALHDAQGPLLAQGVAMLRRSRRFGGGIGRLAEAVNAGDAQGARAALTQYAELHWEPQSSPAQVCDFVLRDGTLGEALRLARAGWQAPGARDGEGAGGAPGDDADAGADAELRDAWALRVLRALDAVRLLCAVRSGPWGVEQVNRELERGLRARGLLGRGEPWYEGRVVMVTRNDAELDLFNGDVGIVLRAGPGQGALRVAFARASGVRWVSPARLTHVDTAFALTVHKSQGSEFGHALLLLGAHTPATRELVYTAVTRARRRLSLFTEQPQLLEQALARRTRRASGLAWRLGEGGQRGDG